MTVEEKLKKLKKRLKGLKSVLLAYSGGVDSSFLLKIAHGILGAKVLAVTALSETYPALEAEKARDFAKNLGVRFRMIRTHELRNPRFRRNPQNRCYFCKKELFARLTRLAEKNRLQAVIDGSNFDDLSDYRPGAQAKNECGVVSPLSEARLTKQDIRTLSKRLGLATWNKPALACLASRIPYHSAINRQRLERIDRAEEILRETFGIKGNLRLRDFGQEARLELDKKEIKKIKALKKARLLLGALGYKNVVVDLEGYRCGRMNELLSVRSETHKNT
jgi:uncharacterized protein